MHAVNGKSMAAEDTVIIEPFNNALAVFIERILKVFRPFGAVNVISSSVTVRFAAGTQREFISLKVNADGKISYDEVAEEAARVMDQFGRQHIYRITITGKASPALYFESDKLSSLGNVVEVKDETSRDEAISKLMNSHHDDALGRFLQEMSPDDDLEIRKKALSYGVDALLSVKGRK